MTMEAIEAPSGLMPAYVAAPSDPGPWPGVVVVHDFGGMSHDLRNQADWLAGEGYLAAAPDLYYWGSRLRCLWTIMREIAAGSGRTFDDIDAVRGWLSSDDRCTSKIGVIGFCMGGAYAVALAPGHGFAAASVNHGGCPKNAVQTLAGSCPIAGSYRGQDRSPMGRSAAPRLEQALTALGVDHDVKVYPGAGHGFLNNPDPADATPLLVFLAKISGTRYHEPSAWDVRRRIADGYAAVAQLSRDWGTARSGSAPRLDGFAELSTLVVKGLAIAGLSRCDKATGDLGSAERSYTDAFRSARWPPNRTSPLQRSMTLPASVPRPPCTGPSDSVG